MVRMANKADARTVPNSSQRWQFQLEPLMRAALGLAETHTHTHDVDHTCILGRR